MGTPAIIAIEEFEGLGSKFRFVSVNYDGYFSDVGSTLFVNYDDEDKVNALIDLGNISVLGASIDVPPGHSFATPVPGYTIAYHRDRGSKWEDHSPEETFTLTKLLELGYPYIYLYSRGQWFGIGKNVPELRPLEDILAELDETEHDD